MKEGKDIKRLLKFEGSSFINEAYLLILNRRPDHEGLSYYMRRLEFGYSKESIIYQLYQSTERNVELKSSIFFVKIYLVNKFLNLPVINIYLKIRKYKYELYSTKIDYKKTIEDISTDYNKMLLEQKEYVKILERKINESNNDNFCDSQIDHSENSEQFKKIILLTMVKNEADIIESFIRHNHIFFDKLIIIDNGSTDGTRDILESLKREGISIEIESDMEAGYSQKEKMIRRYTELTKHEKFDFLVIIDADEFINSNDKDYLRRTLQHKDTKYFFEWANYVPIGIGYNDISDPLRRITRRNAKKSLRKVVIPNFGDESIFVQIWQGNHDFDFSVRHLHFAILEVKLAHFPVRSINQIESKAIIGWLSYLIKNRNAKWSHEGLQWRVIYERIQDGDISEQDLSIIANCYSDVENINFDNKLIDGNLIYDPVMPNYNSIKYWSEPSKALSKAAQFCEKIINKNWELRSDLEVTRKVDSDKQRVESSSVHSSSKDHSIETKEAINRDDDIANKYLVKNLFKNANNIDIIFISEFKHVKFQTLRYRCFNLIDYLSTKGWNCGVIYSGEVGEQWFTDLHPTIAVFIRVEQSTAIKNLISRYRKNGVKIIFDIDDLVFDEIVFLQKITVPGISKIPELLNSEWASPYREEARFYRHVIQLADAVTTTTPYLANEISPLNKNVFVIKNSLSNFQVEIAKTLSLSRQDNYIRVGYFSGSPTHNADFLIAAEPLYSIMRRYRNVKLVVVGFIQLPDFLHALGDDRIEKHPPLDSIGYFEIIGQCDICIAPLEDNVFNQGKSELKVFEASAWGIPTIASATDTLTRCITDGFNGIIANDRHSWEIALDKLVSDPIYRKKIGDMARNTIANDFSFIKSGFAAEKLYSNIITHIN
ncbi:glycosyltransferase family 2 protein [Acidithiobacillus concretivorus]|uniref:Glycosyltransferase n=1 Tax=Acidithiobacillus concretivorus TaxID=3063952 RepID=A0ABS5ZSP3_9PROT|nr:glycosyltransferase family 2 protein [Acidithiobacillus concretivorus]MBU2739701.1 glycosyltransferase [Acidithiobacillus concretivorus]